MAVNKRTQTISLPKGTTSKKMAKEVENEKWVDFKVEGLDTVEIFKISDHGKIRSFKFNKKNGQPIKASLIEGYPAISLRKKNNKTTTRYVHKLVAMHFIKQPSEKHRFVLHKDYDKKNNKVDNLVWATKEEVEQHRFKNPNWINRKITRKVTNAKLTEAQVRQIKKKLNDPERKVKLKKIAEQFGVHEMQIYRIKRGENWAHIVVEEKKK